MQVKIYAGLAASAVMAFAAGAADAAENTSWTGFYVGANIGYDWSTSRQKIETADPQGSLVDPSGLTQAVMFPNKLKGGRSGVAGGGQVGYNYQFNTHVIGAEIDFSGLDSTQSKSFSASFFDASKAPFPAYFSDVRGHVSVTHLGTARLRAGENVNGILLYATGGLAFGAVHASSTFADNNVNNPPPDVLSGSKREEKFGYTIGGGVEFPLIGAISTKVEYIFYDLGSVEYDTIPNAFTAGDIPGVTQHVKYRANGNLFRVGLNYKF